MAERDNSLWLTVDNAGEPGPPYGVGKGGGSWVGRFGCGGLR